MCTDRLCSCCGRLFPLTAGWVSNFINLFLSVFCLYLLFTVHTSHECRVYKLHFKHKFNNMEDVNIVF